MAASGPRSFLTYRQCRLFLNKRQAIFCNGVTFSEKFFLYYISVVFLGWVYGAIYAPRYGVVVRFLYRVL